MNIPPKYEDVVAQLEEAMDREAEVGRLYDSLVRRSNREREASYKREDELREELATSREAFKEELDGVKYTRRKFRQERDALQQRLTVAEQLLRRAMQYGGLTPDWRDAVEAALKPVEEGEGS